MDFPAADDPLNLALTRELRRGERIMWSDRPIRRLDPGSFGIWLFAVPWTAFSIVWTVFAFIPFMASTKETDWGWIAILFPLFGVPFIVVGLGMLSAPFLPLYFAGKTVFAVTNQRLIKLTLKRQLKSETVPAERIGLIQRTEKSDGSGTLKIATKIGTDSDGARTVDTFNIGEVSEILLVEEKIYELTRHTDAAAKA